MTSIAVLGTEGAGKTVLVSCLVKFVQSRGGELALNPQSAAAQKYVERVWRQLAAGDWPKATPAGHLPILDWTFHLPGVAPLPFRVIDPPGHDIRRLFSDDATLSDVPSDLQPLAEVVRVSEVVILLINLADLLGEADEERRLSTELTVQFVLDALGRRSPVPRVALVLTQADLFPQVFQTDADWRAIVAEHLPLAYQAIVHNPHYLNGGLYLHVVAAVNRTQKVVDDDGRARRVPAQKFQSEGLDSLVQWIQWAVTPAPISGWEAVKAWFASWSDTSQSSTLPATGAVWNWFFTACILLMIFGAIRSCGFSKGNSSKASLLPAATPRPVIASPHARYLPVGFLDYDVEMRGSVKIEGASGLVTVFTGLTCGQRHWDEQVSLSVLRGNTADYRIRFATCNLGQATFAVGTSRDSVRYPLQPVSE